MINSVLFVCVGNICRSPLAEYWAREQLSLRGHYPELFSAGLGALVDHPIASASRELLAQYNINSDQHRAQQLSPSIINNTDLILTMEDWQTKEIVVAFPSLHGRIFRLGHWQQQDIADPYKKPFAAFEQAFEQIRDYWKVWQDKLWV